jgi:hypothetical protein
MFKAVLVRIGILLSAFVGLSSSALAGKAGGGGSHNTGNQASTSVPTGNQTQTRQQPNSVKGTSNTTKSTLKKNSDTDSSIMQNLK